MKLVQILYQVIERIVESFVRENACRTTFLEAKVTTFPTTVGISVIMACNLPSFFNSLREAREYSEEKTNGFFKRIFYD